jgi:ribosomal protein S18 acetylase RimI-like enzyme
VTERSSRPTYHEPGRSYLSAIVLTGLLVAGFVTDLAIGGGRAHLIGWVIALVLVVGIDLLVIGAARTLRSVSVTDEQLIVGEQTIDRNQIIGIERDLDPATPVLGRTIVDGLPRGWSGLALHLADDRYVIVPTRRPDRLAAALATADDVPDIRPADPDELPLLAEIDERAESLFRVSGIDLPPIPFPVDELHDAKALFVVGRPPVGFVRVDEVDGLAHIEELAVIPGRMRRGLGSALLEAACAWSAAHGYRAITLITFADVSWNAPFYAARGFVDVTDLTPEIVELRDWEKTMGLDRWGRRVVMRRELT